MDLEKKIYLTLLYDIYYLLFTSRQQEIIELFFEEDLTISEIADDLNITLSAVSKTLSKAEIKLEELENKLNIYKNYKSNISLLKENNINENIIKKIK